MVCLGKISFLFVIAYVLPIDSYNLQSIFVVRVQDYLGKSVKGEISVKCKKQLELYLKGLKNSESWALRMYDSGAKLLSAGVLDGNVVDLGAFDECINIKLRKPKGVIYGKYCLGKTATGFTEGDFYVNQDEGTDVTGLILSDPKFFRDDKKREVKLGNCFPSGCTTDEMEIVYKETLFEISFDNNTCQTQRDRPKFDAGAIATVSSFGIILGLVIISTAYDIVIDSLEKKSYHPILTSFSLLTNGRSLFKTGHSPNDISCMHGLRVISTMWIILDHRYSIQFQHPVRNSEYHDTWLNNPGNMFMISATLGVDTFLLLSGTLISYNFMRASSRGKKFNIFIHYIHRYLRLTPPLVIVMLCQMYLVKYTGSGPFWPTMIQPQLEVGCHEHWWKALLYIQNIFGRGKPMCVSQTWYLSLDMQLFLVSPFLIVPMKRWPKLTLIITGALLVLSMVVCFAIAWIYELNAFMQGNHDFDKQMDYVWLYYFPIHTRAGPWLIGIIFGYFIFEIKEGRIRFMKNKIYILILWINFLTVLCLCVFPGSRLLKGNASKLANSLHLALVRPVWAAAVAWVILACINGRGGIINWFLSLPTFQVVSKLTYTLYIVHYPLIFILTSQMKLVSYFSNAVAMYRFWGDFALSLLLSLILTLTIEFPFMIIDKVVFGRFER